MVINNCNYTTSFCFQGERQLCEDYDFTTTAELSETDDDGGDDGAGKGDSRKI